MLAGESLANSEETYWVGRDPALSNWDSQLDLDDRENQAAWHCLGMDSCRNLSAKGI